ETSSQAATRSSTLVIGVRELAPSSWSMRRRERLSTTSTSWPRSDRWRVAGQPQKPSPPRTAIFTKDAPSTRTEGAVRGHAAPLVPTNLQRRWPGHRRTRATDACSALVGAGGEGHGGLLLLAVAQVVDRQLGAGAALADLTHEGGGRGDVLAVHADHEVALLQ